MLEFLPEPIRGIVRGTWKIAVLGFVVLYVISPIDLLPEAVLGPIGLIDDILVVLVGTSLIGFDFMRVKRLRSRAVQK